MKKNNLKNLKLRKLRKRDVPLPGPSFLLKQNFEDNDINRLRKKIRTAVKFYFEELCEDEMLREDNFESIPPTEKVGQC